jgi:hypothetical protein
MSDSVLYFGFVENSSFHIKRDGDRIYFSKYYPDIRVSWQFNNAGRIDRITGRKNRPLKQQNAECYSDLVRIDGHQNPEKEKAWITSTATLFPLPPELNTINWKFANQPYYQQYLSLFTFGHGMVRECFAGIVAGRTEWRHKPNETSPERPLSDIKQGMLEYAILEQASCLRPRAYIKNRSQANVRYEVFVFLPPANSAAQK